jgi:hypothetical protein
MFWSKAGMTLIVRHDLRNAIAMRASERGCHDFDTPNLPVKRAEISSGIATAESPYSFQAQDVPIARNGTKMSKTLLRDQLGTAFGNSELGDKTHHSSYAVKRVEGIATALGATNQPDRRNDKISDRISPTVVG